MTLPHRLMAHFLICDTVTRTGCLKYQIDRLQDGLRRPEGPDQINVAQRTARFRNTLVEMIAHSRERGGVCPLKAKNRLFRIADREHGTIHLARTFSGEKFFSDLGDDPPLFGVRVLRLIDKNMVKPTVQFEQHPRRPGTFAQKIQALQDQIVIIQPRPDFLFTVVGGQQRIGQS